MSSRGGVDHALGGGLSRTRPVAAPPAQHQQPSASARPSPQHPKTSRLGGVRRAVNATRESTLPHFARRVRGPALAERATHGARPRAETIHCKPGRLPPVNAAPAARRRHRCSALPQKMTPADARQGHPKPGGCGTVPRAARRLRWSPAVTGNAPQRPGEGAPPRVVRAGARQPMHTSEGVLVVGKEKGGRGHPHTAGSPPHSAPHESRTKRHARRRPRRRSAATRAIGGHGAPRIATAGSTRGVGRERHRSSATVS